MDGGAQHNPLTVEEVFMDFKGRRVGILKALTTDVEYLYQACNPERKKQWLYAFASEQWEVGYYPSNEKFPEPRLDIKLGGRDGKGEKEWLTDVAARSDACLLSLAFYFAGRFGFDQADRERLFSMINGLPTIYQVVAESRAEKQVKEKPVLVINHNTNQSNSKKG